MARRKRTGLAAGAVPVLWVLIGALLGGCDATDTSSPKNTILIRMDQQTVTKDQFDRAFETAKIAFSDSRNVDPQLMEQARLRMLNQMVEELIIGRRASELGIVLSDKELDATIQSIKKDYPDDEFEQMLLESAIPFSLWKDRLRARLLIEKVIDRDLAGSVSISAADIEQYYKAHENEFAVEPEKPPEEDLKHRIVQRLRREKVEAAYPGWMDTLRKRYQVEINWELWGASTAPGPQTADQAQE